MVINEERFEISNERFGGSEVEVMREDKEVDGAMNQLVRESSSDTMKK